MSSSTTLVANAIVQFFLGIVALAFLVMLLRSIRIIQQGTVSVTTLLGKYRRILHPGLHILIPFIEKVNRKVSIQNRTTELEFQAITQDQAKVGFKAMILWAVADSEEETIKNVAFKFRSDEELITALERSVEGETRGIVANKKQSEVLTIRSEIVSDLKAVLDANLQGWGYKLVDVQINDVSFDDIITNSMAQVVASSNLKAAATNEGDALLIKKTKEAEAEGAKIRIAALAEKEAAQAQGEGVALFRKTSSEGLTEAVKAMSEAGLHDAMDMVKFSMWTEAIKYFAEKSQGNVIFLDGSPEGQEKVIHQLMASNMLNNDKKVNLAQTAEQKIKLSNLKGNFNKVLKEYLLYIERVLFLISKIKYNEVYENRNRFDDDIECEWNRSLRVNLRDRKK